MGCRAKVCLLLLTKEFPPRVGELLRSLSQEGLQTTSISSTFCLGSVCSVYSQVQLLVPSNRGLYFLHSIRSSCFREGLGFEP